MRHWRVILYGCALVLFGAWFFFSWSSDFVDLGPNSRLRADFRSLDQKLKAYAQTNGFYPSQEQGLQAFVERPASDPQPASWRRMTEKLPRDPWDSPYQYRIPSQKSDGYAYDIYSLGKDRKESGDDVYPQDVEKR